MTYLSPESSRLFRPESLISSKKIAAVLYFIFILVAWAIQLIVKMGLIKITLAIIDKGSSSLGTLFSCTKLFGKFLAGAILYALIVLGGFILLIVPGVIWSIKYQFFSYLIVDKNLSPLEAIKKSGEITAGYKGSLFLLGILLMLINILGFIFFVVGLFATIPLSMIAIAYVYRKLMGEMAITENVEVPPVAVPPTTEQPA